MPLFLATTGRNVYDLSCGDLSCNASKLIELMPCSFPREFLSESNVLNLQGFHAMKKYFLNALLVLASSQFVCMAQETKPGATKAADKPAEKKVDAKATDDKKADAKTADAKPDEKKPGNRLPSNYGKLGLTEAQRSKIYGIQDKHETEIDELNDKLKAAKAKRDSEIEGILTPEQKKALKDLTAAKDPKPEAKDKAESKEKAEVKVEAKDKK